MDLEEVGSIFAMQVLIDLVEQIMIASIVLYFISS